MFLINRNYLQQAVFDVKIKVFKSSIKVKNINFFVYDSFEYININFYVSSLVKFEKKVITHFIRKLYIVNELKTKIFINMNILSLEKIDVLHSTKRINILSYENFIVNLIIILKD